MTTTSVGATRGFLGNMSRIISRETEPLARVFQKRRSCPGKEECQHRLTTAHSQYAEPRSASFSPCSPLHKSTHGSVSKRHRQHFSLSATDTEKFLCTAPAKTTAHQCRTVSHTSGKINISIKKYVPPLLAASTQRNFPSRRYDVEVLSKQLGKLHLP